jgi:hypothetical protein
VKELIPDISNEQINLHFLSYKNSKIQANSNLIKAEKNWLVYLSKMNDKKKKFPKNDLDSLLFSRWIIFCLKIKKPFLIPFIKLPWYTPQNITQTFILLLRK